MASVVFPWFSWFLFLWFSWFFFSGVKFYQAVLVILMLCSLVERRSLLGAEQVQAKLKAKRFQLDNLFTGADFPAFATQQLSAAIRRRYSSRSGKIVYLSHPCMLSLLRIVFVFKQGSRPQIWAKVCIWVGMCAWARLWYCSRVEKAPRHMLKSTFPLVVARSFQNNCQGFWERFCHLSLGSSQPTLQSDASLMTFYRLWKTPLNQKASSSLNHGYCQQHFGTCVCHCSCLWGGFLSKCRPGSFWDDFERGPHRSLQNAPASVPTKD